MFGQSTTQHLYRCRNIRRSTAILVWSAMASFGWAADAAIKLQPSTIALFDEGSFTIQRPGIFEENILFRLFVPASARDVDGTKKYPAIVWLHGHGELEFKSRNGGQLLHVQECILSQFLTPSECELYILVVRCPSMKRSWFGPQPSSGDEAQRLVEPGEAVIAILDQLMIQEAIDPERISLVGISSGGTAAWEMAARYPNRFSAVAPTASAGTGKHWLSALREVPVWAFHSERDTPSLKQGALESVDILRSLGGAAWFTEVPARGLDYHNAWQEAFTEHGLLQWLLAQRRGQGVWISKWQHVRTAINYRQLTPYALLIGLGILAAVAWWSERIRRAKLAASRGRMLPSLHLASE